MNEYDDGRMYYYKGVRFWLEGVYIWLGKRLPPGLVFYAAIQLEEFADERRMDRASLELAEILSEWMVEKMR